MREKKDHLWKVKRNIQKFQKKLKILEINLKSIEAYCRVASQEGHFRHLKIHLENRKEEILKIIKELEE